jgi:predicted amidophosphoribosyltransferase
MDALDHFWHVCAALMARVKRAHHGSSCAACGVSLGFRAHYCTTCLAAASEPHKTPLIKAKDGHGRDTG